MCKRRRETTGAPEPDEPALTDEEIRESDAGWAEHLAGKSKPLDQVIQEQLRERTTGHRRRA